ncbi:hypothetical protein SCHPADRAFT_984391 [Schizopora paradoxa]|uniref:Uncharacterized protein n=1 Tax=Schizopora paradoxa TaxID=27342 RepID=A0A0H2R607_9AGAM|nr:hypothetical protein SCHPADRAFT_984391 [Schizopora paradoxa]
MFVVCLSISYYVEPTAILGFSTQVHLEPLHLGDETVEKNSPKLSGEEDQALAKRRRQRAAKKERKRRQRNESAAPETQHAVVERQTESVEEKTLEMDGKATVVEGKGALSSSFDNTETIGIDWADDVDASIPCLQPMFITEPPPRDLSCLRTDARSPWSSLCRRHQRIQRRQNFANEPSYNPVRRSQRSQRFISRADASTWWRRSQLTPAVQPHTGRPLRPHSDRRWQPPSASRHRFKSRQTSASLLPLSHLHYKTDRLIQTDPPPSSMSSCSVQTETSDVQPAVELQDCEAQTDILRMADSGMQTTGEQPSKTSCTVQADSPRTSDSGTQTIEDCPPKISRAVETSIPPLRTRIAPIVLNTVAETASPRDETFQALLRFEASPRYKTVLQALEPFHDLLFSYVAHPHGRYEPLPVTLPTDPAMQFVEMYVKGWFKTWLKNKP